MLSLDPFLQSLDVKESSFGEAAGLAQFQQSVHSGQGMVSLWMTDQHAKMIELR
jgi:hypothetical protein